MNGSATQLRFILDGPPVPKQRARMARSGHWYTPPRTRRYEKAVRELAQATLAQYGKPWPTGARFYVQVDAHFPDARRRDADNVAKSVLDACNRVLWVDDSQVSVKCTPHIDRKNPRTDVRVEELLDMTQLVDYASEPRKRVFAWIADDALRALVQAADRALANGFHRAANELHSVHSQLNTRLAAALIEDSAA